MRCSLRPPRRSFRSRAHEPGSHHMRAATARMRFVGANPEATFETVDPLPGRTNYFVGRNREAWRTGVRSYGRIRQRDIYPGIDVVYYGNQRQLEYDFIVAPRADPGAIDLAVDGAERLAVDEAGHL